MLPPPSLELKQNQMSILFKQIRSEYKLLQLAKKSDFIKHIRRSNMLNALIKLFVSKLNGLLLLVALTGFVCTHKIQAEEECLSSNVICYECDSRYDSNCADPFDLPSSSSVTIEPQTIKSQQPKSTAANDTITHNRQANYLEPSAPLNETNSTIPQRQPKKLPAVVTCHGCCVKITSKTHDGNIYVKRTCTSNLQINYFMVGLVCMKESGDRGKMCFCENDYCNGQPSSHLPQSKLVMLLIALFILQYMIFSA